MIRFFAVISFMLCLVGCGKSEPDNPSHIRGGESLTRLQPEQLSVSPPIVAAARNQVGKTRIYDPKA